MIADLNHSVMWFERPPLFSPNSVPKQWMLSVRADYVLSSLASLRYDLGKLRAKHLVEKLPKSRRYRLCPQGYSICLVFLKLFEGVYSPLAAGLLQPYRPDSKLQEHKRTQLDRLYQKIADDLDELLHAVGLKAAA
jgi:hypothetical protein